MKGEPTEFWVKLKQNDVGELVACHPLHDHCDDVAAVCERLLQLDVLRARLAQLTGLRDLDAPRCQRRGVLAALHDLAKHNVWFSGSQTR